ncbi:unnamed protein product [Symbiodinium natans]|uniref:Peptidase A2 domain-containing protein n=1 Tax=Symbiodinium natans TaxID=878477 RepID=A0A812P6H3_9DINO|nr:unnamed protein product [Symbiodinium natans]
MTDGNGNGAGPHPLASPALSPVHSPTGSAGPTDGETRLLKILAGVQQNQQVLTELVRSQSESRAAAAAATTSYSGLAAKDLSKVLRHPSTFSCQTRDEELIKWPAWSWEFEQYWGTLDKEFQVDFTRLKSNPKTEVLPAQLSATELDRSRIMYGLLASLLNDRLKRLLKTVSDNNGYEAYRLISLDLRPSSRTRALALMQTIHNWPVFDNKQGLLTQVVRLEQAMAEYDSIASQAMSDDQKVIDSWTYAELRSLVARYDASSSKWSASVAATYGLSEGKGGVLVNAPASSSEAVPMEIDRLQKEIDRLSKGKTKKGDKGDKGGKKGRYDKGKKGKGDGKKGDGKVEDAAVADSSAANADTALSAAPAKSKPAAKPQVRRVTYNLDDFDESAGGEIRMVSGCDSCVESQDKVDRQSKGASGFFCKALSIFSRCVPSRWCVFHNALPSDAQSEAEHASGVCQRDVAEHASGVCQRDVVEHASGVTPTSGSVRMVQQNAEHGMEIEVIIDSGADASCLPQNLSMLGVSSGRPWEGFQDAQGNQLLVHGTRRAELRFGDQPGFTETFLVAPHITTPLLAVGKLYRAGFSMVNENGNMSLSQPPWRDPNPIAFQAE